MKKILSMVLTLATLLTVCACGGEEPTSSSDKEQNVSTGAGYYESYAQRANANENDENAFYDTFSGGPSNSLWYLLDGAWHNNEPGAEHNGVRSRNVYLVENAKESHLAFMGRGEYYKDETTKTYGTEKPEGAALLSQKAYGPGRYEIRMKAHPREGAVSTMWTYMMRGNEAQCQHEIDIELGGLTNGTHYKNAWFTSWVTHTDKDSHAVDVSEDLYLNDGNWHTYTFDWYTNYNGTNKPRIDFFIDGKFYTEITVNVPEYAMPIWVGVWFPPYWAGSPLFDRDYMYVDYVKHVPFTDQYYESVNYNAAYTKTLPSNANIKKLSEDPVVNKLANGSFEYSTEQNGVSALGWALNSISKGSAKLVDSGRGGKAMQLTTDAGESMYLYQKVTDVYEGYTYNLSGLLKGENASLMIREISVKGDKKTTTIKLDSSSDWKEFSKTITAGKNCYTLEIYLIAENSTVLFDDVCMQFVSSMLVFE